MNPDYYLGTLVCLLIPATYALGSYANAYRYAWVVSLSSCGRDYSASCAPLLGWSLFAITLLLNGVSAVSWYYTTFVGLWAWRRMGVHNGWDAPIMQVRAPDDGRRRWCHRCLIWQPDRWYHCEILDRCFPLFDHTCLFFPAPIFRDNSKPYSSALPLLALSLAWNAGLALVLLWSFKVQGEDEWSFAVLAVAEIFVLWESGRIERAMWVDAVFNNRREQEHATSFTRVVPAAGLGPPEYVEDPRGFQTFNCGWRENLRLNSGPIWEWPSFWRPSPIAKMDREGRTAWSPWITSRRFRSLGAFDFGQSETVPGRREQSWSSGIELAELTDVVAAAVPARQPAPTSESS